MRHFAVKVGAIGRSGIPAIAISFSSQSFEVVAQKEGRAPEHPSLHFLRADEFGDAALRHVAEAVDEVLDRRIGSAVADYAHIQTCMTMDTKGALKTVSNP